MFEEEMRMSFGDLMRMGTRTRFGQPIHSIPLRPLSINPNFLAVVANDQRRATESMRATPMLRNPILDEMDRKRKEAEEDDRQDRDSRARERSREMQQRFSNSTLEWNSLTHSLEFVPKKHK